MKAKSTTSKLWWSVAVVVLLAALGTALWLKRFGHYTPVAVALDLRAAVAARNSPRSVERFLEIRYGPLTQPANRQKAFVDFFNVEHMEGLYLIVKRIPAGRKENAIAGMAQWVADYRQSMSPGEKDALSAYLQSPEGRATLQRATSEYLRRDVAYRAATAPVIKELMATLAAIQEPR